ncbi:SulP family inorganic anion transporter [Desulfonatronospira sp.]|uniref:SulP family inorganic anion transporter n=1 Tax=Desulfonatronospira sp. TaxID=1962951 RepID=UPI0025C069E3|nr:SulP family inorganic anion transporter [Desulfonatronospira sp.]
MPNIFQDLSADLKPRVFFPAVSIGLILGLLVVILEISFAAMIFAGELSHLAIRGAGLTLFGGFICCLVVALTSSFKSSISVAQDAPAAIFSGAAAAMAAQTLTGTGDMFMTIVAGLMLSTLLTTVFLFLVARFRLVHFFRYIPYPVIGGFLAGSGWILSTGSLEVMLGAKLDLLNPGMLLGASSLVLWLPGTALAVVLFSVLRKFSHFTILPAALILGVAVFHLALFLADISLDQAREAGLLFEALGTGGLWPVFSWSDMTTVNWQAVFSQLPVLLTIPFIALMGLLLNMNGIELASGREIHMNREIMANSLGNFLAGLGGSHAGYSALSLSMLGLKTGAYSRIVGLTAAVVMGLTLFWGGFLVSIFPKAVLGGFLMLLGFFFLWDWVVESRKKMVWSDYLIVLVILVIIAWLGFFQGVMLGILLSVILFVVRFSQVPVLRNASSGLNIQSSRVRPLPHKKILLEQASRIRVFRLSGYLFFGSVNSLVENIDKQMQGGSDKYFAVMDFSDTTGVDVSSVSAFVRLMNRLGSYGAEVVFTGASPLFLYQLNQHLGLLHSHEHFKSFPELDHGLEWAEDRIIEEQLRLFETGEDIHARTRLFDCVADEMLCRLEQLEQAEKVMHQLDDYAGHLQLETDQVLIRPGEKAGGIYWIQQGKVHEVHHDGVKEISGAEFGPGDVINLKGFFQDTPVPGLYKAGSACRILYFSRENLNSLQKHHPAGAAMLYSVLLKSVTAQPGI